ncbi:MULTISPECIES: trypsin-like serine protease [Clostridium]|uniref:Peptidase S1 domain-containing protein n=1 Tax=Clostridium botulinum D str. 1873 TaxID=592027 RepID=A0A9N7AT87_CLOBO|nr:MULTISPECIES: trypsin-like serine protease [Clostridium]ACT33723.1 conserved hypothetical protein [Clostridium botulinum D str. 1873]AYF55429.1 hypothetical protein DFH04_11940 [Clostridium novyi]MBO3442148.1 hypothetical protein [Clostridium haemolyticum]QPW56689.1 hypothetical protein IRP61_12240 [Clostridium botulinum]
MTLIKNNSEIEKNIAHICHCDYKYFLKKRNVVGLGLGYKVKNGFHTNQLCVQVLVSRKFPENEININDKIPSMYKGIPTDVKATGYFRACSFRRKKRPVLGGYSASGYFNNEISGTAGCLVTNGVNKFVLGTNHVFANLNMFITGTSIIQPAYEYGGRSPSCKFATLYKFIPLRFIKGRELPTNLTDCALALLTKPNIMSDNIALIGKVTCVKNPKLGKHVKKVGATTELTEGTITNTNATVVISYENNELAVFKDQIITSAMGAEGDSGSILVDDNNCALGLLFSTSEEDTVYNRLTTVLDQLDVRLPD